MKRVIDFVKWGLTHVKKSSVPIGAILPVSRSEIGSAGEWEYLFGTTGVRVTQSILDERYRNYYSKNNWTRDQYNRATQGWLDAGKVACDCQGVEDAFSKSQTNANGNYVNYCTDKGLCAEISRPYVIGEALFNGSATKKTHVGWICGFMPDGDPLVMEERGLAYGFVITRMSKRPWKYRGLMTKRYNYDGVQGQIPVDNKGIFTFTRVLKLGCVGEDVKELKKVLDEHGYSGLTVTNNTFGKETAKILRSFQTDHGLTIDGEAGSRTYGAMGVKYKL